MTAYTCTGNVRGNCGHRHNSLRTAMQCQERDQRDCARQGGYSDRNTIVIEDGKRRRMTDEEHMESLSYHSSQR